MNSLATCGRGCNHEESRTCLPNVPEVNTIEQFNVCCKKMDVLKLLCRITPNIREDLIECWTLNAPHMVKGILLYYFPGVELSVEETCHLLTTVMMDASPPPEEEEEDDTDTRPLITEKWKRKNHKLFKKLSKKPTECSVCLNSSDIKWDGCLKYDRPTKCTHWFCSDCFTKISRHENPSMRKCPICRYSWI